MALRLPNGPFKNTLGWSRYRDANPVPTTPLTADLATAPLGSVNRFTDTPFRYRLPILSKYLYLSNTFVWKKLCYVMARMAN